MSASSALPLMSMCLVSDGCAASSMLNKHPLICFSFYLIFIMINIIFNFNNLPFIKYPKVVFTICCSLCLLCCSLGSCIVVILLVASAALVRTGSGGYIPPLHGEETMRRAVHSFTLQKYLTFMSSLSCPAGPFRNHSCSGLISCYRPISDKQSLRRSWHSPNSIYSTLCLIRIY